MRNQRPPSIFGRIATAFAVLWLSTAAAQVPQGVPEQYQRFFSVYKAEDLSISERVLNLAGLTRRDVGRSFALIAGVSVYTAECNCDIQPSAEDVRKLVEYLKTYEYFDEIIVLENEDVSIDNFHFFLESYFPERIASFPKSRFFFAYSGHGVTGDKEQGFLLTSRARSFRDRSNMIPMLTLRAMFQGVVDSGYHVLALLNACYSGSFIKRSFGPSDQHFVQTKPGAHVITAGGSDELTWHDPMLGSGSIFFEKVFAALDERADTLPVFEESGIVKHGDGIITVDELSSYLRDEISLFTDNRQNPIPGDLDANGSKGGFVFLNRDRQVTASVAPVWNPANMSAGPDEETRSPTRLSEDLSDLRLDVVYFPKEADRGIVESALKVGRIRYRISTATRNPQEFPTNSLACQEGTPLADFKRLAKFLIDRGIKLQQVVRFRSSEKPVNQVELLTTAAFDSDDNRILLTGSPLSVSQIEALTACPISLTNAIDFAPDVSWSFYGVRSGAGWTERYFSSEGMGDGYPVERDVVQPLGDVNLREGPIEYVDGKWTNRRAVGVARRGDRFEVIQISEVYPDYVWVQMRELN